MCGCRSSRSLSAAVADGVTASLKKGAHVQVEGELRSRKYEKEGGIRRTFECRVESILKLDRAARQEAPDAGEDIDS